MNTQSAQNRIWLQEKLKATGLTEPLAVLAAKEVAGEPRRPSPWSHHYCQGYSDGHNVHHLSGKRLDHYASAYADICELAGFGIAAGLFFKLWELGTTFEGTATEHWYLA